MVNVLTVGIAGIILIFGLAMFLTFYDFYNAPFNFCQSEGYDGAKPGAFGSQSYCYNIIDNELEMIPIFCSEDRGCFFVKELSNKK